jgi:hypothetical protein
MRSFSCVDMCLKLDCWTLDCLTLDVRHGTFIVNSMACVVPFGMTTHVKSFFSKLFKPDFVTFAVQKKKFYLDGYYS